MDLLERINDTLPDALWGIDEGVAERMEALADQHAVGFAKWLYFNFTEPPAPDRYLDLDSIYKRRHPNGY